jgi:hypothetical protein
MHVIFWIDISLGNMVNIGPSNPVYILGFASQNDKKEQFYRSLK